MEKEITEKRMLTKDKKLLIIEIRGSKKSLAVLEHDLKMLNEKLAAVNGISAN